MYDFTVFKSVKPFKETRRVSTWWEKWLNNLVAVELQNMSFVQKLNNYFITQNWQLQKSKWYTSLSWVTWTTAITMLEKFDTNKYIYWTDNDVKYYNAWTVSTLKWDFTTTDRFSWVKYWEFFYTCNWWNKIWVFLPDTSLKFLTFTWETWTDATVWLTVTDSTSTSTWVIRYISYTDTTTWVMVLWSIVVVWAWFDWWTVTWTWWSATWSTLVGSFYEIPTAPKAKFLYQFNGRLFAWNTDSSSSEVKWSKQDTDFNKIPFLVWTSASSPLLATDPWSILYRTAWDVVWVWSQWWQILVWYKDWKTWFRINTLDVTWTWLSQTTLVDFQKVDFWMERWFINTVQWVFYVNEWWIWLLKSWWNTSQPFSENEWLISRVLWEDFIKNIDFTDADIVFDTLKNKIYVTCKESSTFNNLIIWYDIETKAFWKRYNMQISRFMKDWTNIYWASSIDTKIYKLFDWYNDDWSNVLSEFQQEIQTPLNSLNSLNAIEIKWFFNSDTNLTISFDIYDADWIKNEDFITQTISIPWWNSYFSWFDEFWFWEWWFWWYTISENIETLAKNVFNIDQFTRIILKIKSDDIYGHTINYIWLYIESMWENKTYLNLS